MSSIPEIIAIAVQHHQAGRYAAAEQIYRQILAADPNHIDALHLLGVVMHQIDQRIEAIDYIQRAIQLNGNEAMFYNSLGNTLKTHHRWEEAVAAYRRAIELKPDYAEAHLHLGNTYRAMEKLDEAFAAYHRALAEKPDYADAYNGLGNVFTDQEKFEEAIVAYRRALDLKPTFAEAHNNLGTALKYGGRYEEALVAIQSALELNPRFAHAHYNLGNAYYDRRQLEQAIACYQRVLELDPQFVKAHYNRACAWLLTGNWEQGWPEYEWRWQQEGVAPRVLAEPLWDGESLAGKTIFLHAEQGLGDTIQFIRFAPLLQKQGATVVVESQEPLLPLLAGCQGIDQCVGRGTAIPPFDVHAPFMSLPRILKTPLHAIPADVPYLQPRPDLVERWHDSLSRMDGFKIGINWQGNPNYRFDRFRSLSLGHFAPLAQVPGVRLISLQKGAGSEQLAEMHTRFPIVDLGAELDRDAGPFMDTAAVMKNLDLVITSDTAVAHLAGALGVPVWVALQFVPDWRWQLDRSDSPWYPTMRLFRQQEPQDWEGVFEQIRQALCERMGGTL